MTFPSEFLWGAATSAYQIEGATREDGRGSSIWDVFAAEPGRTYQGQTGEVAIDHYHRMEQDVGLMAELGLNAYRFSIAWPRILPEGTGQANPRGLDFYSRLVDRLLEQGITPVATLYHWDLPLALFERGGWRSRDTALAFADYAELLARHLGDRVRWWVTQNEPWCAAYLGYGDGLHAPGVRGDAQAAVDVGHHLLLGHGLAIPRIRAQAPAARVGAALNLFPIFAGDQRPETLRAVQRADRFHNRWFLDPLFRGEYPAGLFRYRPATSTSSARRPTSSASITITAGACARGRAPPPRRRSRRPAATTTSAICRGRSSPRWAGKSTRTASTWCSRS